MAKFVRDDDTVSGVFRYLLDRSGRTIPEISIETKIPEKTLYSLSIRTSRKADMKMLRTLADYFGEDLDIFCGLDHYQKKRLSGEEDMLLQQYNTLTDDAKLQVMGLIMRLRSNPENIIRLV